MSIQSVEDLLEDKSKWGVKKTGKTGPLVSVHPSKETLNNRGTVHSQLVQEYDLNRFNQIQITPRKNSMGNFRLNFEEGDMFYIMFHNEDGLGQKLHENGNSFGFNGAPIIKSWAFIPPVRWEVREIEDESIHQVTFRSVLKEVESTINS